MRCLPSDAALFKDCEHVFRWFLAPYASIYVIGIAADEAAQLALDAWVAQRRQSRCEDWLVVLLSGEAAGGDKAEQALLAKYGGSSVVLASPVVQLMSPPRAQDSELLRPLLARLAACVSVSFATRHARYQEELRRLEDSRVDLRERFIVRESLALMLQMMRLPALCLREYDELAALVSAAPAAALAPSDWPLAHSPDLTPLSGLQHHATQLAVYSINTARTRVLRSKMGRGELLQYVFARRLFLLTSALADTARAVAEAARLLEEGAASLRGRGQPLAALHWATCGALSLWAQLLDCDERAAALADLALLALRQLRLLLRETPHDDAGDKRSPLATPLLQFATLDTRRGLTLLLGGLEERAAGGQLDEGLRAAAAVTCASQCVGSGRHRVAALLLLEAADKSSAEHATLELALDTLGLSQPPWPRLCFHVLLRLLDRGRLDPALYTRTAIRLTDAVFEAECASRGPGFLADLWAHAPTLTEELCMPLRHCCSLAVEGALLPVQRGARSSLTLRLTSRLPLTLELRLAALLLQCGEDRVECTATSCSLRPGENCFELDFAATAPAGLYIPAEICVVLKDRRLTLLDEPASCASLLTPIRIEDCSPAPRLPRPPPGFLPVDSASAIDFAADSLSASDIVAALGPPTVTGDAAFCLEFRKAAEEQDVVRLPFRVRRRQDRAASVLSEELLVSFAADSSASCIVRVGEAAAVSLVHCSSASYLQLRLENICPLPWTVQGYRSVLATGQALRVFPGLVADVQVAAGETILLPLPRQESPRSLDLEIVLALAGGAETTAILKMSDPALLL